MKPCPVCERPVGFGATGSNDDDSGFVVYVASATYVVHGACLAAFIGTLKASTSTWALEQLG